MSNVDRCIHRGGLFADIRRNLQHRQRCIDYSHFLFACCDFPVGILGGPSDFGNTNRIICRSIACYRNRKNIRSRGDANLHRCSYCSGFNPDIRRHMEFWIGRVNNRYILCAYGHIAARIRSHPGHLGSTYRKVNWRIINYSHFEQISHNRLAERDIGSDRRRLYGKIRRRCENRFGRIYYLDLLCAYGCIAMLISNRPGDFGRSQRKICRRIIRDRHRENLGNHRLADIYLCSFSGCLCRLIAWQRNQRLGGICNRNRLRSLGAVAVLISGCPGDQRFTDSIAIRGVAGNRDLENIRSSRLPQRYRRLDSGGFCVDILRHSQHRNGCIGNRDVLNRFRDIAMLVCSCPGHLGNPYRKIFRGIIDQQHIEQICGLSGSDLQLHSRVTSLDCDILWNRQCRLGSICNRNQLLCCSDIAVLILCFPDHLGGAHRKVHRRIVRNIHLKNIFGCRRTGRQRRSSAHSFLGDIGRDGQHRLDRIDHNHILYGCNDVAVCIRGGPCDLCRANGEFLRSIVHHDHRKNILCRRAADNDRRLYSGGFHHDIPLYS
ncbi:hypothetical protein D3C76_391880 [compost metagenome]